MPHKVRQSEREERECLVIPVSLCQEVCGCGRACACGHQMIIPGVILGCCLPLWFPFDLRQGLSLAWDWPQRHV